MSNLHSEASYMDNLFNEISPFLSLKGRSTKVNPVTSEESSDNILNSVPASTYNCGKEPPQEDSQLETDMEYDSTYNSNNVLVDIASSKTENTDESQCKNIFLEDFKCHGSKTNEKISLPNENQSNGDMLVQTNSLSNGNKRSSQNSIYSEDIYEAENDKKKQLVQNTFQDEENYCSSKTLIEKNNFGNKIINAAQKIEQVETKDKIIFCTTDVDIKAPDELQCCQIIESDTLIGQQHFSTSLSSSEIHDNFQYPSDTKNTHTYPNIALNKPEIKNIEIASKSNLCCSTEGLQSLSSPGKNSDVKFCYENCSISSSSDDGKSKATVSVPYKLAHAISDTVDNLINKPMVYSGEIAKVPCVAINKALSNFHVKLSNQPKQVYAPSRFLNQQNSVLKSNSIRNISSESNVPILTQISPVMEIYPNIFSLNSASTSSSPQKQTVKHTSTSLRIKREKRSGIKTVVLKSTLPSTIKMVAKYVSVSGFSPVTSSITYSTAGVCDQKVQPLTSSLLKNTPMMLPSTKAAVGNTEVTYSVTATQSSSSELAPAEMPVTESSMTALSILPSVPKEYSDTHISITSQSAALGTVKLSAQKLQNKRFTNDRVKKNEFIEDLNCHLFPKNAAASSSSAETLGSICKNIDPQISSEENIMLNAGDSDAIWTEGVMVQSKGKEQMVKAHSSSDDMSTGNVPVIRQFKLGSRTTSKKKNKCRGVKTIGMVYSTRKHRRILPKCESEIKYKEKLNNHDSNSSIAQIEYKDRKMAKFACNTTINIEQNNRITISNDSVFPEISTNKSNILNETVILPLDSDHELIDNIKPKLLYAENKSVKFIESSIHQQDISGRVLYSESTPQEHICSPSLISVGSDKRLQEETFTPPELNNIVSSSEPECFSAEHDYSRKLSYSAAYDNANKRFNNFSANSQTSPLCEIFSSINDNKYKAKDLFSSTVHQMEPTSQIDNPCLSDGDANIFLKENGTGNYGTKFNTNDCKFTQETYSNVSENENNWHNRSKEWKYVHQQLSKLSQNNGNKVNISLGKKQHNEHCQTTNGYENEIGSNIQNIINEECIINEEENNLLLSGRNFRDMLAEPHPSAEQAEFITFFNDKQHLMECLHGKTSTKNDGDVQQFQSKAMQKHSEDNENIIIPPLCKQEKTSIQHSGKCCRQKRKTKGPSKTALKLERDKPYICFYCGKSEQYKAILQRHIRLEHAYMLPASVKI